jgi:hypothetical protein
MRRSRHDQPHQTIHLARVTTSRTDSEAAMIAAETKAGSLMRQVLYPPTPLPPARASIRAKSINRSSSASSAKMA